MKLSPPAEMSGVRRAFIIALSDQRA